MHTFTMLILFLEEHKFKVNMSEPRMPDDSVVSPGIIKYCVCSTGSHFWPDDTPQLLHYFTHGSSRRFTMTLSLRDESINKVNKVIQSYKDKSITSSLFTSNIYK